MQCFSCVMQSSGRHATIPSEKVGANLFVCVAPAAELPACVPPVAVGTASVALKPPLASSEVFDWLLRVNSTLSGAPASFAYMPAIPTAPILMVPTQAQHRPNTGPTQARHRRSTGAGQARDRRGTGGNTGHETGSGPLLGLFRTGEWACAGAACGSPLVSLNVLAGRQRAVTWRAGRIQPVRTRRT